MKTIERLPVSSLETPILEILSPLRSAALDAVEDLMNDAYLQIGSFLVRKRSESDRPLVFDRQTCGLTPFLLKQLFEKASDGTLGDWLFDDVSEDHYRRFYYFLDLRRMQLDDFRSRFPMAFQKWSPEEDAELLRLYHLATEGGQKVLWKELEVALGRNENAIKLRLGRLGIDLGDETGIPRRR